MENENKGLFLVGHCEEVLEVSNYEKIIYFDCIFVNDNQEQIGFYDIYITLPNIVVDEFHIKEKSYFEIVLDDTGVYQVDVYHSNGNETLSSSVLYLKSINTFDEEIVIEL